jgi:hypothetical protein
MRMADGRAGVGAGRDSSLPPRGPGYDLKKVVKFFIQNPAFWCITGKQKAIEAFRMVPNKCTPHYICLFLSINYKKLSSLKLVCYGQPSLKNSKNQGILSSP